MNDRSDANYAIETFFSLRYFFFQIFFSHFILFNKSVKNCIHTRYDTRCFYTLPPKSIPHHNKRTRGRKLQVTVAIRVAHPLRSPTYPNTHTLTRTVHMFRTSPQLSCSPSTHVTPKTHMTPRIDTCEARVTFPYNPSMCKMYVCLFVWYRCRALDRMCTVDMFYACVYVMQCATANISVCCSHRTARVVVENRRWFFFLGLQTSLHLSILCSYNIYEKTLHLINIQNMYY